MNEPAPESPVPRLAFTPDECAASLGISTRHLSTITKQGLIPVVRLGNLPRYPVDLVREVLRERALRDSPEKPPPELETPAGDKPAGACKSPTCSSNEQATNKQGAAADVSHFIDDSTG